MTEHLLCLHEETRGRRDKMFTSVRQLSDTEVERLRRSMVVIGTMTGNNLIKPLVEATNALAQITQEVVGPSSAPAMDIERRQQWSVALDVWLVHVAMMRRRTEREVRRALGDEMHAYAVEQFEEAYRSDAHFRFAWEWRNVAQHEMNPLELTTLSARLDANERPVATWSIAPTVTRQFRNFRAPAEVAALVENGSGCWTIVTGATSACDRALSAIIRKAEPAIVTDANWVFNLAAEALRTAVPTPGVDKRFGAAVVGGDILGGSMTHTALRYDLAMSALLTVDSAREAAGMPRLHTPKPERPSLAHDPS